MIVYIDEEQKVVEISIREIAFSAATSTGERYISRRLRALIGHQAHNQYQMTTDAQTEYYVKFTMEIDDWTVLIRGRVDIVDKQGDQIHIEEIKSTTQKINTTSDEQQPGINLDEAYLLQLQLYCHYFYAYEGFSKITANLVMIDPVNKKERKIPVNPRPMDTFLTSHLSHRIKSHIHNNEIKEEMKKRVATITFPFDSYRPHQQELITTITDLLPSQPSIMLHAPPGIGKTITTLFPVLSHGIANGLQVFAITSKTTQQLVYKATIRELHDAGADFRAIQITAKGKICKTEQYDCYDNDCPYFDNYFNQDPKVMIEDMLRLQMVDREPLERMGNQRRICPFELSLDVALHCDVIVSDFNYIFHPRVQFQRFRSQYDESLLIVDEAHNLVDRARDYFSDTLSIAEVEVVIQFLKQSQVAQLASPLVYKINRLLKRIIRYIQRMKDQIVSLEVEHSLIKIDYEILSSYQQSLDMLAIDYLNTLPFVPEKKDTFIKFCDKLKFFTLLLKESEADEFEHIYDLMEKQIRILCTSAANKLAEQMELFDSVIVQSATLQPLDYYQDMLGMPQDTHQLAFKHPFDIKNRLYLVDNTLSTTYKERGKFMQTLAKHIARLVQLQADNYLVFFSSFSYLQQVQDHLISILPIPQYTVISQKEDMNDQDRNRILAILKHEEGIVLMAVMGGIFSEGVDFKGNMAIGACIVGPGLPQINFDNELRREYFDSHLGRGFDYAYKYPGIAKVIQSAGRVFRSDSDRGFVVFMGHRFSTPEYMKLLPEEYQVEVGNIHELEKKLQKFWQE